MHAFRMVSDQMPEDSHQKLSNFQSFVLTCMKLRLDLGLDLGFNSTCIIVLPVEYLTNGLMLCMLDSNF
jgi:hypothetical protein